MVEKEEVQLVDMVLRIRNKLAEVDDLPDIVVERLTKHIDTIVRALPPDLQAVLTRGNVINSSDVENNHVLNM